MKVTRVPKHNNQSWLTPVRWLRHVEASYYVPGRVSRERARERCVTVLTSWYEREMERPAGVRDNTRHCRLDREAESILRPSSNDLVCVAAEFNQAIRLESQPTGSIICRYIALSLSISLSLLPRLISMILDELSTHSGRNDIRAATKIVAPPSTTSVQL